MEWAVVVNRSWQDTTRPEPARWGSEGRIDPQQLLPRNAPVGFRTHDRFGGDVSGRAWPVLDDELLADAPIEIDRLDGRLCPIRFRQPARQ